ncbi:MAG: type 1 glutamine amidotransferase domain-containing protein [Phycisphaerales bacterium]
MTKNNDTKQNNNDESVKGARVAILATDGFEQSELFEPKKALDNAGAKTEVIAPKSGSIKGWNSDDWGESIKVDKTLDDANPDDYDGLVLPGGVMNPDTLRMNEKAIKFIRAFFKDGKPVSAICHGPQLLIEAEVVEGRKMTSYPSVKTDLMNAGANWVDEEVVVDEGLTTSRSPDDLPAFCRKTIEEIGEGVHQGQKASV